MRNAFEKPFIIDIFLPHLFIIESSLDIISQFPSYTQVGTGVWCGARGGAGVLNLSWSLELELESGVLNC